MVIKQNTYEEHFFKLLWNTKLYIFLKTRKELYREGKKLIFLSYMRIVNRYHFIYDADTKNIMEWKQGYICIWNNSKKQREKKERRKNYSWCNPIGKSGKINKSRNHKTSYQKRDRIYLTFIIINWELFYSH